VARLKDNAAAAHQLQQAIATRLTTTDKLTGAEALELGNLPREGKTMSPFTRAYKELAPPPSKKARASDSLMSGPVGDITGIKRIIALKISFRHFTIVQCALYLKILITDPDPDN
jgi:hypothetical protein